MGTHGWHDDNVVLDGPGDDTWQQLQPQGTSWPAQRRQRQRHLSREGAGKDPFRGFVLLTHQQAAWGW